VIILTRYSKYEIAVIILLSTICFTTSCGRKDFRRDFFTVREVISGNELLLVNDYKVTLIGIEANEETAHYLEEWYASKQKIRLTFDKKTPFYRLSGRSKNKRVYAYVKDKKGNCLNTDMLKKGLSSIAFPQPYLSDSLEKYLSYVSFMPETNDEIYFKPEKEEVLSQLESHLSNLKSACDYMSPITRDFAVSKAGNNPGEFNVRQICDIFSGIYTNWKYVNDPYGMEFFSPASRTIASSNLSGDCDDFAILMYSSILAIGGEAQIIFAFDENSGHAFVEVNVSQFGINNVLDQISGYYKNDFEIDEIYYREEPSGTIWLNMDYWAQHPGGKYMDSNRQILFLPHKNEYYESN